MLFQNIKYKIIGTGEPVLLIHGLPSTDTLWDPIINLLSDQFKFICVNLSGFGGSKEFANISKDNIPKFLDGIDSIMKLNGIEKYHVVGHSFGAALTVNLYLSHNDSIKSIFLSCPLTHIKPTYLKLINNYFIYKFIDLFWNFSKEPLRKKILIKANKKANGHLFNKQRALQVSEELCFDNLIKNIYRLVKNLDFKATEQAYISVAGQASVPVTLLGTLDDQVIPHSHFKLMKKKFTRSDLIILNGGHTPMQEYSAEYASAIKIHINKVNVK